MSSLSYFKCWVKKIAFCFQFPTMCASKRVRISCCLHYRGIDRWYIYGVSQLTDSNPFQDTHCFKRTRLKCCHRNIFSYIGLGHHNSRNDIFILFPSSSLSLFLWWVTVLFLWRFWKFQGVGPLPPPLNTPLSVRQIPFLPISLLIQPKIINVSINRSYTSISNELFKI